MALLGHANEVLPLKKLATLCRRAENEYVGAKSGIMDQFVVGGAIAFCGVDTLLPRMNG